MDTIAFPVFTLSLAALLVVFLNPLLIWAFCLFAGKKGAPVSGPALPDVDFVIVVRNGEEVIENKIRNALALDYPDSQLRILAYSDGSTDATGSILQALTGERVRGFSSPSHEGKNLSLNRAVSMCTAPVLVFSDADTELAPGALKQIARHFGDPEVGGVCGNKVIRKEGRPLGEAQNIYTLFANHIKNLESRAGSVSTNDGTLYGIRRDLFREVPSNVTDDLYVCLTVISQNFRFLFEPESRAFISPPSRSTRHEFGRRRRIVARSLRGLWLRREVLNPFRHGIVAFSLICNKVLRRFLPFFLAALLVSNGILAVRGPAFALFFALQALFYGTALLYGTTGLGGRAGALAHYFVIGNAGSLLGVFDFLRGRDFVKWNPE